MPAVTRASVIYQTDLKNPLDSLSLDTPSNNETPSPLVEAMPLAQVTPLVSTQTSPLVSARVSPIKTDAGQLERDHIKNDQLKDTWVTTCCGQDKQYLKSCIKYSVQVLFSLAILLFSMFMVVGSDPGQREVWISTIGTIVGLHVPNPQMEKEE